MKKYRRRTYRFEMYAHQEISVYARNAEEAYQKAENIWHSYFGKKNLFGDVELVKELDNE